MPELMIKGLVTGLFLAFAVTLVLPPWRHSRWVHPLIGLALGFVVAAALPGGLLSFFANFCIMASIYAILALGLNVQWGYTGHLNFGIAGFFAVGAFTSTLVTIQEPEGVAAQYTTVLFGLNQPFLIGVLAAALVSALIAYLIAGPVLRLRMDFLAISTIGIAEIIRLIFQNERWLANGPQPIRGIPQPAQCLVNQNACPTWLEWAAPVFANLSQREYEMIYLLIVTAFLAALFFVIERLCHSPWGRRLRAVRDEEASSAMNGKHVAFTRVQSFVVGAAIMGIGGALYAHHLVAIDYSHFHALFGTFIIWVMLMLGGSGNNTGAVVGAFIIWGVWSGTAFLANALEPAFEAIGAGLGDRAQYIRWLLVSLLLALIVLFRPHGLIREEKWVSRYIPEWVTGRGWSWFGRRSAAEESREPAE